MTTLGAAWVAILCTLAAAPAQHPLANLVGRTIEGRVTAVSDGDTLDVVPAGETRAIRVRVFGIDAPEQGEPYSAQARNRTRVLAFDKRVRVTGVSIDTYSRLVARVQVGDVDLGLDLLSSGLACHYRRYSDDPGQARAEAAARSRAAGFWAAGAPKPRCAVMAAPPTAAATPRPVTASGLVGNTSSRVFHAPTCRNAGCKNCVRRFATRDEAIAAGFRPAGDCLR